MDYSECIHIVGPYPPPYGGVSVHIARMIPFLQTYSIPYILYDQYGTASESLKITPTHKSKLWWLLYLFKKRPKVVHFHAFSILVIYYSFFYSLFSKVKVVVSIHDENILNKSFFYRICSLLVLRNSPNTLFVCVSLRISEYLKSHSVRQVLHIPAYIPPVVVEKKHVKYDRSPKIFFNAWRLNESNSGIYGFDLLLELAIQFRSAMFYVFVGDRSSGDFVLQAARNCELENIECLIAENLVDYLSDADVFLRLNREDGYGVSVKEALDLGIPVIASDVCSRAEGAILFESGSLASLTTKVEQLIKNNYVFDRSKIKKTFYHLELIDIYRSLLKD